MTMVRHDDDDDDDDDDDGNDKMKIVMRIIVTWKC